MLLTSVPKGLQDSTPHKWLGARLQRIVFGARCYASAMPHARPETLESKSEVAGAKAHHYRLFVIRFLVVVHVLVHVFHGLT